MFRAAHRLPENLTDISLLLAFLVVAFAAPALAQETREDQMAAQQAEKATRLHPYEPDRLERRLDMVKRALLAQRSVFPFIGSTLAGGGLAFGPGYRARYGDTGAFDAHAAWSVKNYKAADAALKLPAVAHGRMTVQMRVNWLDAPDVAFYGAGNDSRQDDRTGFSYRATTVGVSTRIQATRLFAVGGGIESIQMETGQAGQGTTASPITAADPAYRRSHVFAAIDSRTSAAFTRRGGLYRLDWSDYRQTNAGPYSFRRVDAEVQQFVPILRENWVIALRALASSTSTASGQDVPYFLMPDLGGSHTLRGYPAWRFRDRNRLLLTGEYRWTAGPFVDMALFMDAGSVASRAKDLDARDFKKTYGVGVSFHTPTTTVMRIEVARAHEGTSLLLSFSPSF